jgi:hypothetical protein
MKILLRAMELSGYKEDKISKYRAEFNQLWPKSVAA